MTEANLDYIGSITIDEDLMNAANIYAGEKVQVVDNTNGARLEIIPLSISSINLFLYNSMVSLASIIISV